MKNKLLLLTLLLAGCKGPTGSKGDAGQTGLPGGHFEGLIGSVISDDFTVFDARINQSKQTTVYISDGVHYTALNAYLPTIGKNAYFLIGNNSVEIVNAKTASGITYLVDVYLP